MSFIVDASVALKWFLADEPQTDRALAILEDDTPLIAPDILIAEVCNAAWRSARLGRLSQIQVSEIANAIPQFFMALVSSAQLAPRAVAIAGEIGHPVYDCLYVALAEAESIDLVTADDALLRKLVGTPWASHANGLADYRSRS
jgi:predicted nucleic acid-binding protein